MDTGQVLGERYRLHERIGEGGMAVVWRATDEVLRRPVAVKVLHGRFLTDPAARLRIQAEARAAARLTHPHVAGVYDYGESLSPDGQPVPFVVMELLEGPTLSKRLREGPLPAAEALRVCAEVASGLAAAHDAGLVHRDVKPANVVLTAAGAKVVDFGIAAAAGPLDDLDLDATMFGTPAYLAPERLIGGDVQPASDVYALGLLLHAALLGRLPWKAETTTQMLAAHVYVEPPALPPVDGVPSGVAELYQRCLAKNPDHRPSAREMAEELSTMAATHAGVAAVPRRRAVLFALAGAGLVTAATVLALVFEPGYTGNGSVADAQVSTPSASPTGRESDAAGTPVDGGSRSGGPNPGTTTNRRGGPDAPDNAGASTSQPPRGGSSPTAPPDSTPTTNPPASQQRTISSAGGTVVATCAGTEVELVRWTPADGYTVHKVDPGPAKQARVHFKGTSNDNVKIRCAGGVPTRA